MEGIDQISQGFDRLKQGASEVGQQMGELLDKAGEAEQNKAFLEIGFNKAGSKQAEKDAIDAQKRIQDIVAKAPGDDTAMNSILSSAVAKDVKLMDKDMQGFADSVSDYFAGAEVNGKHAAEAIQDVRSYITSGNVAELETTGIFDQSQLDQLKDIDDVGERVAKFQEMVNQSSYAGLGTADTLNNKWAEFGGMMDKSRTQLGGFFTDATKGTLDWILNLNDATGGLAGMGLALVQMASPVTDVFMGLGQMATGMKAIKDLGFIKWLKDLEIANKLAKISQLELNLSFLTNPIFLVVAAIVALVLILGYLYFNNEQVRAAIDGLGQTFIWVGQVMYTSIINAVNWIISALQNFYTYVMTLGGLLPENVNITGNQIIDSILAFLAFFVTLPIRVGMILINTLAKVLGFKGNFVQTVWRVATDAVSKFTNAINGIGQAVQNCLDWAYNIFMSHPIVQAAVWLGQAIANGFSALGLRQKSPGDIYKSMKKELIWTQGVIEDSNLPSVSAKLGSSIVDGFGNPTLGLNYEDTMNAQLESATSNNASSGNTYNFNMYGDMDNDDRMEKFLDAVARRLHFENSTAGRTV